MARDDVQHTTLTNGLTVVVETMPAVRSAAFTMLIPAGSMFDVRGQNGTATALADWITRGAGDRSSREVLAELDRLGIQSRESASAQHLVISGTCLAEKMSAALQIYADVILHPTLDDSDFGAVMSGLENGLLSIEDDPQKKAMVELVRRCYPLPLGQPAEGTLADLENLNPEIVRGHYQKNVRPNGAILGIAGNVTLDDLLPILENSFEAWRGGDGITLREGQSGPRREHLFHESIQTHIGVAYPAVAYSHPDYYSAWAAVSVLSGGMSSRLFTEVREKRGLCYSVYAALNTPPQSVLKRRWMSCVESLFDWATGSVKKSLAVAKRGQKVHSSWHRNPRDPVLRLWLAIGTTSAALFPSMKSAQKLKGFQCRPFLNTFIRIRPKTSPSCRLVPRS